MTKNYKLLIEYDGTNFNGWQVQPDAVTVQGEIQNAIQKMTRQTIIIHGSGRTDAGVHACGQVANFNCDTRIKPEEFQRGINSIVPDGIVIKSCTEVETDFHARFSAKKKNYRYRILNSELAPAIGRNYVWHIKYPLDILAMTEASRHLLGTHDFKSFEGSGSPRPHTTREVYCAEFENKKDGYLDFHIRANGFLRFMVRNIVGTLVDVGLSKISPDEFKKILIAKDRNLAGPTAPPQGLFLVKVDYA